MKKSLYRWIAPPTVAILTTVIDWDIGSLFGPERHFWEANSHFLDNGATLVSRLAILLMAIPWYYLYHFVAGRLVRRFAAKSKNKITAKEFLFIVLHSFFAVTVGAAIGAIFVSSTTPVWTNIIRNYGLLVPVLFIYYIIMRNRQITEELNRQSLQLEKVRSNQLETELKYLRAQYHPHFLFNALNTVYFQIDEQNTNARNTVELLSELLRYQLYNMEKEVEISEEINFIKSYIRFQQLRMTKRLAMTAYFDEALDKQKIYPLIYQPFLENAFKYVGGKYWINMQLILYEGKIIFALENSLPEDVQQTKKNNSGIGIENIKRRLALLYPERHDLSIKQDEKSFIVELIIKPDFDGN